jgi:hypothetical protein
VGAMRDEPQLRLRVINDEIVVTLPGYHYAVTYSKPSQGRVLIARNSPPTDDLRIHARRIASDAVPILSSNRFPAR